MIKGTVFGLIWGIPAAAAILVIASLALPLPHRLDDAVAAIEARGGAEAGGTVAGSTPSVPTTPSVPAVPEAPMPEASVPAPAAPGGDPVVAPPVETPYGSEFARGGADVAPDLPSSDPVPEATSPGAPEAGAAAGSETAALAPSAETAPRPEAGIDAGARPAAPEAAPESSGAEAVAPPAGAAGPAEAAPRLAAPGGLAPPAASAGGTVPVQTPAGAPAETPAEAREAAVAPRPETESGAESGAEAPQAPAPEAATPDRAATAPGGIAGSAPDAPPSGLPEPLPRQAGTSPVPQGFAPVPPLAGAPGVRINELPRIGEDDAPPPAAAAEAPPGVTTGVTPRLPALLRNAVEPKGGTDGAQMAIVLMDRGPSSRLQPELLADLPMAVTVAVDPVAPGAAEAARTYRAAGLEVAILAASVPVGATPSDFAQLWQGYLQVLPEAVAVMEGPEARLQSDRALAQQLVGDAAEGGYGLVTWDRGLDQALQIARGAHLPAAQVYRLLDGQDEQAPLIGRYLDRAAFEAGRTGGVIVTGAAGSSTLGAILDWAMRQSRHVSFVPLSTILQQQM